MTFNINISADTAAKAFAELLSAADFYRSGAGASVVAAASAEPAAAPAPADKPARAPRAPKATTPEPPASPPASAAASTETPGTAASPSTSAPAETPAAASGMTLEDARARLQPLLRDPDLSAQVVSLIASIGGATKLSLVKVELLPALVAAAEAL